MKPIQRPHPPIWMAANDDATVVREEINRQLRLCKNSIQLETRQDEQKGSMNNEVGIRSLLVMACENKQ